MALKKDGGKSQPPTRQTAYGAPAAEEERREKSKPPTRKTGVWGTQHRLGNFDNLLKISLDMSFGGRAR